MNEEQLDSIYSEHSVLTWVSSWWNSGDYVKYLYEPLSKLMSEDDIKQLSGYICNHLWPEMEIDFADAIMGYMQSYLLEDEEE